MSALRDIEDRMVHTETVPGARYWSLVIRRGFTLRLVDVEGRANVSALLFNPQNVLERYNAPDTLKGQHTSKLTKGNMLYSDMGRVMLSIVEDTVGWHDTIGGVSDASMVRQQYGEQRYQEHRNAFYRSGRELFLIELQKWGLGRRDLVPNLNFFSKVSADLDGTLRFADNHSQPGAYVDLRAEMDTLVVLNTAPHPMDPSTEYRPGMLKLAIYRAPPVDPETDVCVNFRPENARAYANTRILNCQEA
ncbi:MAG: urea carboxylase-associated family protein [Ectothiorhodospiraceae bacterium]|nr:urea carboxylase-associated family protein [Ectothiorhodospiraceae bacterium]